MIPNRIILNLLSLHPKILNNVELTLKMKCFSQKNTIFALPIGAYIVTFGRKVFFT